MKKNWLFIAFALLFVFLPSTAHAPSPFNGKWNHAPATAQALGPDPTHPSLELQTVSMAQALEALVPAPIVIFPDVTSTSSPVGGILIILEDPILKQSHYFNPGDQPCFRNSTVEIMVVTEDCNEDDCIHSLLPNEELVLNVPNDGHVHNYTSEKVH